MGARTSGRRDHLSAVQDDSTPPQSVAAAPAPRPLPRAYRPGIPWWEYAVTILLLFAVVTVLTVLMATVLLLASSY